MYMYMCSYVYTGKKYWGRSRWDVDGANEQVGHRSGRVGPKQGRWNAGEMGGRWVRWGVQERRERHWGGGREMGEADGR